MTVTETSDGRTYRSSGCVDWPTHLATTGEGGTWVLAIVPDDMTLAGDRYQDREQRPFERCHMDTLPSLGVPNVIVDPDPSSGAPYIHCPHCDTRSEWNIDQDEPYNRCPACRRTLSDQEASAAHYQRFPLYERLWPLAHDEDADLGSRHAGQSRQFLACVCLGSTDACFLDPVTETYYQIGRDDLHAEGRNLIDLLERLYGRPVELLTLIDT